MWRYLATFAWLRFRQVVNGLRSGHRRGGLEALSRYAAIAMPILIGLIVVPMALGLGVLGFLLGFYASAAAEGSIVVSAIVRVFGILLIGGVVISPLVRSSVGHTVNLERLLLLPIPRSALHTADVASSITDPWILMALPALIALPAGMLAAGTIGFGLVTLVAMSLMTVSIGLIATLAGYGAILLFRDRRRGELVSVVMFGLLALSGVVPMALERVTAADDTRDRDVGHVLRNHDRLTKIAGTYPWYIQALPSELAGRAVLFGGEGRYTAAAVPLAGAAGLAAGLFRLSRHAHRRILEQPEISGTRSRAVVARFRSIRIPGLSETASAIAATQARTAYRTLRGKLGLFLTPMFVAVFGFILFGDGGNAAWLAKIGRGPILAQLGTFFAYVSFVPLLSNLFATDRTGLGLLFVSPAGSRDIIRGKVAGAAALVVGCAAACVLVALAVLRSGSIVMWSVTILNCVAVYLPVAAVGVVVSIHFPKVADLNRTGKRGNPHPVASLLTGLATMSLMVPGTAIAFIGILGLDRPSLAIAGVTIWGAVTSLVALGVLNASARRLDARRENLALVAQER